jgi:hypothetical protein
LPRDRGDQKTAILLPRVLMLHKAITFLLVGAILLAVAALISVGMAALLAAGGDQAAARVARWAAAILGALGVLDLIALLLAVAAVIAGPFQHTDAPNRHPQLRESDQTSEDAP